MQFKRELKFNVTIASLLTLTLCFNWFTDVSILSLVINPILIGGLCFILAESYYRDYSNYIPTFFPNHKHWFYLLLLIISYGLLLKVKNTNNLVTLAISYVTPIILTPLWIRITQKLIYQFSYKIVFGFTTLLTIALILTTTYLPLVSIDSFVFTPLVISQCNHYAIYFHLLFPFPICVLSYGKAHHKLKCPNLKIVMLSVVIETIVLSLTTNPYPYLFRFSLPLVLLALAYITPLSNAPTILKRCTYPLLRSIFSIPFIFLFCNLWNNQSFLLSNALIYAFIAVLFVNLITLLLTHTASTKEKNAFNRAGITINARALSNNINAFQTLIGNTTKICAVLKGNAYGHNAPLIAHICQDKGIDMIAVACLKEAIELRKNGIDAQILILGDTHPNNAKLIAKYHLMQTISSLQTLQMYQHQGYPILCALAIDTGMHRLGIDYNDVSSLTKAFQCSNITIAHIFSHLSDSEALTKKSDAFTLTQIAHFDQCIAYCQQIANHHFTTSLQASFGTLNYPQCNYDYVRLGITLYGVTPNINQNTRSTITLNPVLSFYGTIINIHHVAKGNCIGYGQDTILDKDSMIATVSIGYVDGLFRNYTNTYGYINGQKAPIIGKICMDLCMLDVSNITSIDLYDSVEFIGKHQDAPTLAASFNTNSVELLSRLSKRLDVTVID